MLRAWIILFGFQFSKSIDTQRTFKTKTEDQKENIKKNNER